MQKFFYFLILFSVIAANVFAAPGRTTYQARIVKPDGYPLESNNVTFRFTILDPTGSCVIYVENYSAVNMANSGGLISFSLGSGVRSFPASSTAIASVFDNSTVSYSCQAPGIYTPVSTDIRKIVMQFNDGNGWQTLPAMSINAVPYAMYAGKSEDSILLNGKADTDFVAYSTIPTCGASQALNFNGATFSCITAGGGTSYTVTASDVTTALGYTPANLATLASSYTSTASFSTVTATVNNLGTSVTAVTTTVSGLSASLAAITSSQWTTSGTTINYMNGNVGINTTAPIAKLHISDNLATNIILDGYVNTTAAPGLATRRARGTAASPTAVLADDYIGTFGARAYGTTGFSSSTRGMIGIKAAENWTDAAQGAMIVFETAANSGTTRTEKMRITDLGNIGIGVVNPVTKLEVSGGIRLGMESATCAAGYAGTIRYTAGKVEYCNGTIWTELGVAGAGVTGFNGSTSSTQSLAFGSAGTAPSINTANGVHTFNIPLAASSSVTAGLLSNTDYQIFTNKMNATSAAVIVALGYTPADNAASGTYVVKTNNLSDLTSATVARVNLGLGTLATLNFLDLSSSQASGTLAIARLPAFSGDVSSSQGASVLTLASVGAGITSGAQYTKVTVDGKGRVTSGAQLSSSDVTVALGYTPQASGSTVSSQWTTSGTTINYMTGNVGIGTVNPTYKLDVYTTGANVARFTGNMVVANATSGNPNFALHENDVLKWAMGNISADDRFRISDDAAAERFTILQTGQVGIGQSAPTAKLHISAGTSMTAPIKLTSSTLVTSPQSGTIEYDGFNYYVTDGSGVRRVIATASTPGNLNNVSTVSSTGNLTLWPANGSSVIVSATTASTDSQTGALVVKGGLGVAGDTNIAGALNASGTIMTSSYLSAASLMYLYGTGASYTNAVAAYSAGERGFTADLGASTAWDLLDLKNANGTQFIVEGGGYTGIGTADPDRRLTIIGDGTAYGDDVMIEATNNDSTGTFAQINLAKSRGNPSARTAVLAGDTLGALAFRGHGSSSFGYGSIIRSIAESNYSSSQSADLRFQTTASGTTADRMIINSAGNVGIGIASPTARLYVAGNNASTSISTVSSTLTLQNTNTTSNALNTLMWSGSDSFANAAISTVQASAGNVGNRLVLQTKTASSGAWNADQLVLDTAGNIGIGISTPDHKLRVVGKIKVGTETDNVLPNSVAGVNEVFELVSPGTASAPAMAFHHRNKHTVELFSFGTSVTSQGLQIKSGAGEQPAQLLVEGNVGIGTTNPQSKFEVSDSSNIRSIIRNSSETTAYNSSLDFMTGTGAPASTNVVARVVASITQADPSALAGDLIFHTNIGDNVTEKMRITSSGNVGIGTASPWEKLHVDASTSGRIAVASGNIFATSGYGMSMESDTDDGITYLNIHTAALGANRGEFLIRGGHGASETAATRTLAMFETDTGNVGIGTITPTFGDANLTTNKWGVLAVAATPTTAGGAAALTLANQKASPAAGDRVGAVHFVNTNNGSQLYSGFINVSLAGTGGANGFGGQMSFYTKGDNSTNSPQRMLIDQNGYVGIGTAGPTQQLHVSGSVQVDGDIYGGKYGGTRGIWRFSTADPNYGIFYTESNPDVISFSPQGGGTATPAMVVYGGNVGIGITNPTYQLQLSTDSAAKPGTSTWTIASDRRLKDVRAPFTRGLAAIENIQPIYFNYKKDNPLGLPSEKEYVGIIAQDIQKNIPEATHVDQEGFLHVTNDSIIWTMFNAIKELYHKWSSDSEEIHRKMSSLEEENKAMKQYLCQKDPQAPFCQKP